MSFSFRIFFLSGFLNYLFNKAAPGREVARQPSSKQSK